MNYIISAETKRGEFFNPPRAMDTNVLLVTKLARELLKRPDVINVEVHNDHGDFIHRIEKPEEKRS